MEQYKFVRELGHGGFGCVWLVKGVSSKKQYVLKQINLQHSTKREQRAAHLEVKLLSTVEHPNIVSYLDSFYNSDGSLFIIMGYCERGDLYNYIQKRVGAYFEEKQIVSWFVQLCMGLKYLHDKNILHRDLKTKNLYLTRGKLIKIGDLGIARVLENRNAMAMTVIGTPFYMSPEVLSYKPYDYKSDIWGLGCCIYEIITLKQAFVANDYPSLYKRVLKGKVSAMPEMYSEELVNIVLTMLSNNPDERPSVAQILLNPFIRKNIQLFLEDSSKTLNILMKKKLGEKMLATNTVKSSGSSSDHCDAKFSLNHKPESQTVVLDTGSSYGKASALTITVPDINGNGDGNDNSQHQAVPTKTVYSNSASKPTYTASVTSHYAKENINPKDPARHFSKSKSAQNVSSGAKFAQSSSTSTHSVYSSLEKRKGERSMEFLINLTYTLKLARSSTVPSDSHVPNLPNIKPGLCVRDGPKLPPSTARSLCYSRARTKLISPSVKSDSAILSCQNQEPNNGDTYVKRNNTPLKIVLPEVSRILFPLRGSSADGRLAEVISTDTNVDKELLTQILSCEQSSVTNMAARQRRREKLKASCVTKSAPASVESLPAILKTKI